MDGAARGKLEPLGIGGVLHKSEGHVLFMCSKYVGVKDSNEAKVLARQRRTKTRKKRIVN